jgi:phenylalanyl-tRNA synthetase beta chain
LIKSAKLNFFHLKGLVQQLLRDSGIESPTFKMSSSKQSIAVTIGKEQVGLIHLISEEVTGLELDFSVLTKYATTQKKYAPLSKFPPIIEDLAFIVPEDIPTGDIISAISSSDKLIVEVSLLDKYQSTRTFHIHYQDPKKNLASDEVTTIRKSIINNVRTKLGISLKE